MNGDLSSFPWNAIKDFVWIVGSVGGSIAVVLTAKTKFESRIENLEDHWRSIQMANEKEHVELKTFKIHEHENMWKVINELRHRADSSERGMMQVRLEIEKEMGLIRSDQAHVKEKVDAIFEGVRSLKEDLSRIEQRRKDGKQ